MNRNDLFKSFNEIDDEMLFQTECRSMQHRVPSRIGFIAASLALVVCLCAIQFLFKPTAPGDSNSSWFVITAHAADGEMTKLELNEGCFNSGGSGENLFGVDAPLFHFEVRPGEQGNMQVALSDTHISILYNGRTIEPDSESEHLLVTCIYPMPGSGALPGYCVSGWFEETTDITIRITDADSGECIEEITVNVCPSRNAEAYALTVTDVKTYGTIKN